MKKTTDDYMKAYSGRKSIADMAQDLGIENREAYGLYCQCLKKGLIKRRLRE